MGIEEKIKRLEGILEEESEARGNTAVADRKPKQKKSIRTPSSWRVILHNDDFTPMEFVVFILQEVFHKAEEEAVRIMFDVHKKGKGIAGIYSYQIAETKVYDTMDISKQNEFPLRATFEEE